MADTLLTEAQINEALASLKGWKLNEEGTALVALYRFADFLTALDFVNQLSVLAEEANHHPDLGLGWGYVRILITTHTTNALTEKDVLLARQISAMRQNDAVDE